MRTAVEFAEASRTVPVAEGAWEAPEGAWEAENTNISRASTEAQENSLTERPAGLTRWASAPLERAAHSCVPERRKATQVPSGDHLGSLGNPGPLTAWLSWPVMTTRRAPETTASSPGQARGVPTGEIAKPATNSSNLANISSALTPREPAGLQARVRSCAASVAVGDSAYPADSAYPVDSAYRQKLARHAR